MQGPLLCLLVTMSVALVGLAGVPADLEGVVQFAFFSFLVLFVVLMVRYLAQDRR